MPSPYPSAEILKARAADRTGLSDFGDHSFEEGLCHFLSSLEVDANLPDSAREYAIGLATARLSNRLEIEHWFRENPDAEEAVIANPVSVTGLPRTGTTALGNMLSLDPQFRNLRAWEQAQPVPPPVLETETDDPRRLAAIAHETAMLKENPEQAAMHLFDVDATVEDVELLGLQFAAQQMTLPIFSYHAWWRTADMRPTFHYHARVARMLQSHRPPNRWLFKAPHHKFHLEAIVDAYPDIRFIFTHRDPAKVVPSYVSFATSHYPPHAREQHDMKKLGRHIHEHLLQGMHQAMEARARIGEDRFLDVYQHETAQDPFGLLERVYAFLDLEFTDETRASVKRWQEANHAGAHGKHRYSAEEYALSNEQIRSDYAFYIRRFDVPVAP